MDITRPAFLEINLNNLQYNIEQIQNKVGKDVKLMPVIKASGYGTYINQRLDVINQFDIVAVAHPTNANRGEAVEQSAAVRDDLDLAIFTAAVRVGDFTTGGIGYQLTAVADAEDRDTGLEENRIIVRRVLIKNAEGAAGQDDSFVALFDYLIHRHFGVRLDLSIDVLFAHLAGCEPAVLSAEIEYQYLFHKVPSFQIIKSSM